MIFFVALVVGLVAGLLAWMSGDNPFAAVRSGGTAFGGTVLVLFAIWHGQAQLGRRNIWRSCMICPASGMPGGIT